MTPIIIGLMALVARSLFDIATGRGEGYLDSFAGLVFSITVLALQLASGQFSPRVLRTFLRDRSSKVTLGVTIGTFTYSLVVLQSVRSEASTGGVFVPSLAVSASSCTITPAFPPNSSDTFFFGTKDLSIHPTDAEPVKLMSVPVSSSVWPRRSLNSMA